MVRSRPTSRAAALLAAALVLVPALLVLAPAASAASGTQLTTDPEGDNPPDGADTDIVRFGANQDPTYVNFYIAVKDISTINEPNGYQVQFKGPETQPKTYNVIVEYAPDGSFPSARVFQDTDATGAYGERAVFPAWKGNELRIAIKRTDIGTGTAAKPLTALIAETFPMSTGINVDQTNPVPTYTVPTIAAGGTSAPWQPTITSALGTSTSVSLSWTVPYNGGSALTGYTVYRDGAVLATTTSTSFSDATVTTGATYVYRVSASNANGEGAPSVPATAAAVDPVEPGPVLSLTALAGDRQVLLSWAPPVSNGGAPVTAYRVHQGTVSGGATPLPGTVTGTSTAVTGLQNGQTYFFRVAAINSVGEGATGAEVSATPSAGAEPPSFLTVTDPSARANGEPTLGVHPVSGAILYQAGFDTLHLAPPYTGAWADRSYFGNIASADPYGHMDEATGRYWASQLLGECSTIGYTDDLGLTWDISQGCSTGGGIDHQTIGSGAWAEPRPPAALYDRAVYYCIQGSQTATCGVSLDGGVTFGPGVAITNNALCQRVWNMIHGHVRVGPDGTAYVPFNQCGDKQGLVFSKDNGVTWTTYPIPGTTADMEFDPSVWATSGHVYHAYVGANQHPWVAISDDATIDEATTWTHVDLGGAYSSFNIQRTAFPTIVGGDADRAAFSFLGSSTTAATTTEASSAVWYAYTAFTYDGGQTWQIVEASPGNIIQRGGICTGLNCGNHRNMLDFMDSTVGPRGEVVASVPDGCTSTACSGASGVYTDSRDSRAMVLIQKGGKTLFSAYDLNVVAPDAPVVHAAAKTGSVRLDWLAPANGNSPITGYKVFRDGALLATRTATQRSYEDTSVVDGTTYVYEVSAENSQGESPKSAAVSMTPAVDAHAPDQVVDLQVTAAADNVVSLLWDAASDSDGRGIRQYEVLRDGVVQATVPSTLTAYTQTGVQNGKPWSYSVRAVDLTGNAGPASDAVTARPLRTPTSRILALDTANDATGGNLGATDIRQFGFLTGATTIRAEWIVRDMSNFPSGGTKYVAYQASFVIDAISYDIEYDAGGTRCHTYHNGVLGIQGSCGRVGNLAFATFDRAKIEETFAEGDTITISGIEAGTITVTTTESYSRNDQLPGTFTYAAGSPARSAQPLFSALGDKTGAEGSPLAFTVSATSPDGDYVMYATTPLPAGASLDAHTGAFAWTPGYSQAGNYVVRFDATTGSSTSSVTINLNIANTDRAPVLNGITDRAVDEGESLSFVVSGSDPDGDVTTVSHSALPGTATYNASTGIFSWAPGGKDAGVYPITFFADANGKRTSGSMTITVVDVNHAPVLAPIGDRSISEAQTLTLVVTGADQDEDDLTYRATQLPPGGEFDPLTRTLTWTPTYTQAGLHGATFEVSDGLLTDSESIVISVGDVDRPPMLDAVGPRTVAAGSTLGFTVAASDPDGDVVTLAAIGLPADATFDAASGAFLWAPTLGDVGDHVVRFTAAAKGLDDHEDVTITVFRENHAPVVDAVPAKTVDEGQLLAFTVTASDPDGDKVLLYAVGLPQGATFNGLTGEFRWIPGYDQSGDHVVAFSATDGRLSASTDASIAVLHVDRAPLVAGIPTTTIVETATGTRGVSASDPDGEAVALSASGLPSWATFTDHGNGLGTIALAPGLGTKGTYTVTITATSNGLESSGDATLVVLQKTSLTLARVGPAAVVTSPTRTFTLSAEITNTGPQADTFTFRSSGPWASTAPADVTLAPGEKTTVSFDVTAPATAVSATIRLNATSLGNPTVVKEVIWSATAPVRVVVALDKSPFTVADAVGGTVLVTYDDGTPIANAIVKVTQTPKTGGSTLTSFVGGKTGSTGSFAFTFGDDAKSRVLGEHALSVVVTTRTVTSKASSYVVNAA